MKFDKEYFPSGLEGSKRISKIERRRYENVSGEGLLLAQEKGVSMCKQESMVNKMQL